MDTQQWIDKGYNLIVEFAPKIIAAILIWIIGNWVIKILKNVLKKTLNKGDYDESLKKFLLNLVNWVLKIVLLIVVILGTVGIENNFIRSYPCGSWFSYWYGITRFIR